MHSWNIYNPSEVFIYSSMTITVQNKIANPLKPGARRWESVAKKKKKEIQSVPADWLEEH